MTAISAHRDTKTALEDADPAARSRALSARRGVLIAAPVLAGLFTTAGAYADPAVGLDGATLFRLYADHPGALQFKSLGFHWGYAFWFLPALLIAPYVRARGAWLANLTAAVGFVGISTLPGLLFIDWVHSAIGQEFGVEGVVAVEERLATMWGPMVFSQPGVVGLLLALPLTAITLWRAGLARWWALAAVVGGFAMFVLSGITWWGCLGMTLCFAAFSVALARATRPAPH